MGSSVIWKFGPIAWINWSMKKGESMTEGGYAYRPFLGKLVLVSKEKD